MSLTQAASRQLGLALMAGAAVRLTTRRHAVLFPIMPSRRHSGKKVKHPRVSIPEQGDHLTFRMMSLADLEEKHGLREVARRALFEHSVHVEPSAALTENLRRGRRSRLTNERARAYRLIDPVISELEMLREGKISSVPEMHLSIEGMDGLCGNPDFIISGSVTSKLVPILAIVEAKKDDVADGIPQCVAELYAAYLLNEGRLRRMYGCVTTGFDWQFLYLDGETKEVCLDAEMYFIVELPRLLGVFCQLVDEALAALAPAKAGQTPLP